MRGSLTAAQVEALAPFVVGKYVADLGAGDLALSRHLVNIGARSVLAVDKNEMPRNRNKAIQQLRARFDVAQQVLLSEPADVAFLSWPVNHPTPGLMVIVAMTPCVVYLGKNSDGTACGTPGLFGELLRRKVLAFVPDRTNTLIVYGEQLAEPREPLSEEAAGLLNTGFLPYDDSLTKAILGVLSRAEPIPDPQDYWTFEQLESIDRAQRSSE